MDQPLGKDVCKGRIPEYEVYASLVNLYRIIPAATTLIPTQATAESSVWLWDKEALYYRSNSSKRKKKTQEKPQGTRKPEAKQGKEKVTVQVKWILQTSLGNKAQIYEFLSL